MNGLRSIIEAARDETGGSLADFTVLSAQINPYRLDTPANHKVGRWFASAWSWPDQTKALKAHKSYTNGAAE